MRTHAYTDLHRPCKPIYKPSQLGFCKCAEQLQTLRAICFSRWNHKGASRVLTGWLALSRTRWRESKIQDAYAHTSGLSRTAWWWTSQCGGQYGAAASNAAGWGLTQLAIVHRTTKHTHAHIGSQHSYIIYSPAGTDKRRSDRFLEGGASVSGVSLESTAH